MKEINLSIKKTPDGYVVSDEATGRISYLSDDDAGRKELVSMIIELMNAELEGGKKYN